MAWWARSFTALRRLADGGHLQLSLFDKKNLAEINSPDYPDERGRKRKELLAATEKEFERIQAELARRKRTPLPAAEIGRKVGRVLDRYKMGKHFETTIAGGVFSWARRTAAIKREAALDGLYVIRSSEDKAGLSADDAVRSYKSFARVERVFRCMKGADLRVRPIFHGTPEHVRAHIFLCLLAYYVEWRMRQALAELLFEDEQLEADWQQRDAVAPAEPSAVVKKKKARCRTSEGLPVHSFATLLDALATRCQKTCRVGGEGRAATFEQRTAPTPLQKRAANCWACSQKSESHRPPFRRRINALLSLFP